MKYLIVIEKAEKNFSAYILDVPGCVVTGKAPVEVEERIKETLEFHLEGLEKDGIPELTPCFNPHLISKNPTILADSSQCRFGATHALFVGLSISGVISFP